jgi:hypothetical protein
MDPRYRLIRFRKTQRVYAVISAFEGGDAGLTEESPNLYTNENTKNRYFMHFTGNRVCGLPAPLIARPANSESSFSGDRFDYRGSIL